MGLWPDNLPEGELSANFRLWHVSDMAQ
jgi:hypothetical protein